MQETVTEAQILTFLNGKEVAPRCYGLVQDNVHGTGIVMELFSSDLARYLATDPFRNLPSISPSPSPSRLRFSLFFVFSL